MKKGDFHITKRQKDIREKRGRKNNNLQNT